MARGEVVIVEFGNFSLFYTKLARQVKIGMLTSEEGALNSLLHLHFVVFS